MEESGVWKVDLVGAGRLVRQEEDDYGEEQAEREA